MQRLTWRYLLVSELVALSPHFEWTNCFQSRVVLSASLHLQDFCNQFSVALALWAQQQASVIITTMPNLSTLMPICTSFKSLDIKTLKTFKTTYNLRKRGAHLGISAEKKGISHLKEEKIHSFGHEHTENHLHMKLYQSSIDTYWFQHSLIISATMGSTLGGISRRLPWKPTAPTTCIEFIPVHGTWRVVNSQSITPKLYTSDLQTRQTKLI